MNNLIKVINPQKANELIAFGFATYMVEKLNGQDVFVFSKTPQLVAYLKSHFSEGDFFYCNKLHF